MNCLLFVIFKLLVFSSSLQPVLCLPVLNSTSRLDGIPKTQREHLIEGPDHHCFKTAHAGSKCPGAHRVATVVQIETWRMVLPSSTATFTAIVEKITHLPNSIMLLSELPSKSSQTHAFTTMSESLNLPPIVEASSAISVPTTTYLSARYSASSTTSALASVDASSVPPLVSSSSFSARPVHTSLSNASLSHPQPPILPTTELSAGMLITVAIVASVAANLFVVIFWVLLRASCSRRAISAEAETPGVLEVDTKGGGPELGRNVTEAPKEDSEMRNSIAVISGANPPESRSFSPQPETSTHQPLPFSFSSFWASASSWTLERARSQEVEAPRRFTTFDLDTSVNPHPDPIEHVEPSGSLGESNRDSRTILGDSSPEVNRDEKNLTIPSAPHSHSGSLRDLHSPRRLSIPLFMENYTSPSLSQYLPPGSRGTMMTLSARDSYSIEGSSVLHELSRGEVEEQLGVDPMDISASMVSLPSVSSEVMTPRRHWTFTDIHGPSTPTANSPQGHDNDNIHDRLTGTESSRTLAAHAPRASAAYFATSADSGALLSEPLSADSFLHSDFESSTSSGFTQYRSANSDSLGHSRRTF